MENLPCQLCLTAFKLSVHFFYSAFWFLGNTDKGTLGSLSTDARKCLHILPQLSQMVILCKMLDQQWFSTCVQRN